MTSHDSAVVDELLKQLVFEKASTSGVAELLWRGYRNRYQDIFNKILPSLDVPKIADSDIALWNNYLKAKAYTLLGDVQTENENYPDARVNFRMAIDLDITGPVGRIAKENLTSISRPQILEEPTDEFICEGDSIMLKVVVFGIWNASYPYTKC